MTQTFLNAEDRAEIKERFDNELTSPVQIRLFTRSPEAPETNIPACYSCTETEGLLRELAGLSENFLLEVIDVDLHPEAANSSGVSVTPTFSVGGSQVRFIGFPAGYEFVAFLETVLSVPKQHYGLDPGSAERVREIAEPIHIKVFSTPT